MKRRLFLVAAVTALLAASCGGGPDPSAGGVITAQPLAYSLTGDLNLDYHTELDTMMTTSFGDVFRSLDPSMPSQMVTEMEMSFDSNYRVESGSTPGTYRVSMNLTGFELGSGSVEMGSESFDFDDLPQSELDKALEGQLNEVVYEINDKGEVLSMEIEGLTIDVNAMLGGTSAGGLSSGQMFGPELPDGEVQVGDQWTTTSEQTFPGMEPIATEMEHSIVRAEERGGVQTWLIKSDAVTDPYSITWEDLIAMAESIGGMEAMGIDESFPPAYQMSMRSAPSTTTTYTWFDPVSGLAVATDVTTHISMTVEMGGLPGIAGSVSMGVGGYTHMVMELENGN